jgi:hypothetical protein
MVALDTDAKTLQQTSHPAQHIIISLLQQQQQQQQQQWQEKVDKPMQQQQVDIQSDFNDHTDFVPRCVEAQLEAAFTSE